MATSEYAEVLASLYALEAAKGMDFKLERVLLALRNLGDPHKQFAAVHIAGTNGKGSVAAMLDAMYRAAGYRVGLYTSPHLVSFTERIRVDGHLIAEEAVVDLARRIHAAATVRGIDLTFFEFITVMAFLHFARCRVDLAVVEVGLGGRLDATNVLDPVAAVITTIGLDHEEFLGNTLESVAAEKAGIIKPDKPVIIGNVPRAVSDVFASVAREQGARAYRFGRDFSVSGSVACEFTGMGVQLGDVQIGLRGAYQRENAATAVAAAVCLRAVLPVADAAIRRGLREVRWPGRLDVVQTVPLVVLDGAHNADGVAVLVRELPSIVGSRNIHLLVGVMRDKRWQPMVEALAPIASSATVTTALPPRGEAPEVLARAFEAYCPVRIATDPLTGLNVLLQSVREHDVVLVTGSLYVVGAVYPYFLGRLGHRSIFSMSAAAQHP